jgi:hypothetical protein
MPVMFTAVKSAIKSEKDLQLQVAQEFFADYAVSQEDKRIDFLVYSPVGNLVNDTYLWAEVKISPADITTMFTQLLLTIKPLIDKGRMPPQFLGVFDKEKMVFLEYHNVLELFHQNDFNWNEKPSSPSQKAKDSVEKYLENKIVYRFDDEKDLIHQFIKDNFIIGRAGTNKARITKNNFVSVFMKWAATVRPTIDINEADAKENKLIDGDFYLGDLLSQDNITLADLKGLRVALQNDHYRILMPESGKRFRLIAEIFFRDNGKVHREFWAKYERPPKEEFHKYMQERHDLLVPQEIRERKGAFFTPQIWVEKAQEYLAKTFGENWQDEYYVWDCCCGTGNLLAGLVNPHRVWASTLDQSDVDIVHTLIHNKKCNLLATHVFQFDFLNGDFNDLPDSLKAVINDCEKQKQLIVFINPPYGECGRAKKKGEENKSGIASEYEAYKTFENTLGKALRDIATLFIARVYKDIPNGNLGVFSKLKYVNAPNFKRFRQWFKVKYGDGFIVPADTFDNVCGRFPISFLTWKFLNGKKISTIRYDAFDKHDRFIKRLKTVANDNKPLINAWIESFRSVAQPIGYLSCKLNDFQNNKMVYIAANADKLPVGCKVLDINEDNLRAAAVYLAVRHVFEHTWLNDRDQFLYPNDNWKRNKKFQTNCLIYTLFHPQNRIKSADGVNHWIPFTAAEVGAKDNFKSTFMSDYISGQNLFRSASNAAKNVLSAGKALWTYYHEQIKKLKTPPVDASLYEIREYFKGRSNGRLNTKSQDKKFNELDTALKEAMKQLAEEIKPCVYEYGFLMQ